jgi:heat shock protein HslJ
MIRIGLVGLYLGVVASSAAAQSFPFDRPFKAVSISGYDVQKIGMTLKVARDGGRLIASGHAGCNSWSATAMIRDEQIDIVDIVTTRKFCGKPRMKSEEAFLSSLRSTRRWRTDDKGRLILEGDAARLLMTSAADDKPQPRKPANKRTKGR